jgi:uncharacterized protein (TIGR00369 family)
MTSKIAELAKAGDIAGANDLIPFARLLGVEVIDDSGLVTVMRFRDTNVGNPRIPALHGGSVGALLEHAAILHLIAELGGDTLPRIINLSTDYLRPALCKDTFARGTTVRLGRRVANVRVEAWQSDPAHPVAAAHAHFLTK